MNVHGDNTFSLRSVESFSSTPQFRLSILRGSAATESIEFPSSTRS